MYSRRNLKKMNKYKTICKRLVLITLIESQTKMQNKNNN